MFKTHIYFLATLLMLLEQNISRNEPIQKKEKDNQKLQLQ